MTTPLIEDLKKITVAQALRGAFIGAAAIVFLAGISMRQPTASAIIVFMWAMTLKAV